MRPRRLLSAMSLLAAAAAFSASVATAGSTAPFRVRADVLPVSCDVILANNGVVDFGVIPARNLSDNAFVMAGERSINLTLTCDAPAQVSITATDGRKGTAVAGMGAFLFPGAQNDQSTFGVGSVDGKNVGGYVLWRSTAAVADGGSTDFIASSDNGAVWQRGTTATNALIPDARMHGWALTGTTMPGAYSTISQTYNIRLGLNSRNGLPPLTGDTAIDGLATITIHYL
ncbi:DUF1120 domain-containing protein [Cupriavidus agavae]|uniref:Uncharacterized protein DUF1120 n=1 Tax=Cupriavidus agavae TaxID=1001822 RepID=A0A4Q7SBP1_9BURK|nr:DUF1120 domain-containing protein [Cupriavidus agavae]RZT42712.1 uncharacterized protein DUF1120 [Cupriavidus agavae]